MRMIAGYGASGTNGFIQAVKACARGYRTARDLIVMIHLIAGKLNFGLPT